MYGKACRRIFAIFRFEPSLFLFRPLRLYWYQRNDSSGWSLLFCSLFHWRNDKRYNHSSSCPVGSHVLIPSNLSVLSSTKLISEITLHFKLFFVLFHQAITIYRCLLMDTSLKNPCSIGLCNLNTTYHFLGRRQTARYVNYSNSQFKFTPSNTAAPNWLPIWIPYTHSTDKI
jgi:hypothetical protein